MDAEALRERGMQSKVRGSDWSEVPTSQGAPRNTWDPQTLQEARRSPSPQLSEGAAPSLTAPSQTPPSSSQVWTGLSIARPLLAFYLDLQQPLALGKRPRPRRPHPAGHSSSQGKPVGVLATEKVGTVLYRNEQALDLALRPSEDHNLNI